IDLHQNPTTSDLFLLLLPRRPRSTLFPYTTLFRSALPQSFFQGCSTLRAVAGGFGQALHNDVLQVGADRLPQANIIMQCLAKARSEEHTSELQSRFDLVCRLLLEKKKNVEHTLTLL